MNRGCRPHIVQVKLLSVLFALGVLALSAPAFAEQVPIYQCTDAKTDGPRCRSMAKSGGSQIEVTRHVALPTQTFEDPNACEVELLLESWQVNDRVRVDTQVLINDSCVASHGTYKLKVRTKAPGDEVHTREYVESWRRTDDDPVKFTRYYDMEGDLDLLWVRLRSSEMSRCVCDRWPPDDAVNLP